MYEARAEARIFKGGGGGRDTPGISMVVCRPVPVFETGVFESALHIPTKWSGSLLLCPPYKFVGHVSL